MAAIRTAHTGKDWLTLGGDIVALLGCFLRDSGVAALEERLARARSPAVQIGLGCSQCQPLPGRGSLGHSSQNALRMAWH